MDLRVVAAHSDREVTISVPGSKSVANRALVCAMLAEGASVLEGLPDGDDTDVIVSVLRELGRVRHQGTRCEVSGSRDLALPGIVDARLAGTSSRFLTAVAALSASTTVIDGAEPLRGRPMHDLHRALQGLGAQVESLGVDGCLPVSVAGGALRGGEVSIRGDVSSQFISALMLIGPLLDEGVQLSIQDELVSRSYVEMTAAVMRAFGAHVQVGESAVVVEPGQYVPAHYVVEPDYSSAAFALVVPAMRGGAVRVVGLAHGHLQGDAEILSILRLMGCDVVVEADDVVVSCDDQSRRRPVDVVMTDCSDLVPAVAVAMSVIPGQHRISGVGFIRKKESNRLDDLAREMNKCGLQVMADDDGLTITGVSTVHSAILDTYHDHRLAMALSLLALSTDNVTIRDAEVVSKSWPTFFTDMAPILSVSETQN